MAPTALKLTTIVSTALLAGLTLTGCTINIGGSNQDSHSGTHMMGDDASGFTGSDIMFAQMMIPHHQQAVDMGTLAETRASNAEVKALAAQIKGEQSPEITQMKDWLEAANAPLEMGHEMGMGGMLTEAQMTALENAKGEAFDRLYLQGMIAHHEGAIHMAQMVVDSSNPEAKALGEAIISSQTEQIAFMKELLAQL